MTDGHAATDQRGKLTLILGVALALLLTAAFALNREAQAQDFDINEVFWCDAERDGMDGQECAEARDTILFSCTSCHSFVPIVQSQKSEEEWQSTLSTHSGRVELSDNELALIRQYLVAHYNPDQPVPELPPELLQFGVDQAF